MFVFAWGESTWNRDMRAIESKGPCQDVVHRTGLEIAPTHQISDLRLLDIESIVVSRNRSVSCVDIELCVVLGDGGILEPNRRTDNGFG